MKKMSLLIVIFVFLLTVTSLAETSTIDNFFWFRNDGSSVGTVETFPEGSSLNGGGFLINVSMTPNGMSGTFGIQTVDGKTSFNYTHFSDITSLSVKFQSTEDTFIAYFTINGTDVKIGEWYKPELENLHDGSIYRIIEIILNDNETNEIRFSNTTDLKIRTALFEKPGEQENGRNMNEGESGYWFIDKNGKWKYSKNE
ncbi:MAG: hypothetical protein PWQ84_1694 [Thermotogaceae bacterium]|nr:hypothetical protein [Thermotogaceae bacterium]